MKKIIEVDGQAIDDDDERTIFLTTYAAKFAVTDVMHVSFRAAAEAVRVWRRLAPKPPLFREGP